MTTPGRHASCRCGQLKVETTGEPVRVSVCHCLACQLRTGSAFGFQARFPRERARIAGRSKPYSRTAESGNRVTYHFCPECGSTVYYELERFPDVLAVPVGAFADPKFPAPKFSIYEAQRHAWAQVPGEVEHSD